jgi:hypothetical protein
MAVNPTAFYTPTFYGRAPVPAHKAVAKDAPEAEQKTEAAKTDAKEAKAKTPADKDKKFSFWDLLDVINPLQHIPIVNSVYRAVTGDEIGSFARVAGGAIFGGPLGAAIGGVNAIVAQETGRDIGELAMNKVGFGKKEAVQVADKAVPKDIPVIEVHPMVKFTYTDENLKDQIVWDKPAQLVKKLAEAAPTMPPAKPLETLPEIKGMNDADKRRIPDMMMSALQKYQEMQSMEDEPSLDAKS